MMRIVSGIYGGRKLLAPKNRDIRPTSDKVRGAIFNSLNSEMDIQGIHVLDAFCGTGALGVEALSRGAAYCQFIDKASASLNLARENVDALGIDPKSIGFKQADVSTMRQRAERQYDLVFLDPPYNQGFVPLTLNHLHDLGVLKDGAICVVEAERGFDISVSPNFDVQKSKVYGDTLVVYICYNKSVM